MKKFLALVLAIALTAAISVGITLAYLTDRDAEVNVFTMGDVDIALHENFEQGVTMFPGVQVTKEVTIENIGDNAAWVWYTISFAEGLYKSQGGNEILQTVFTNTDVWTAGAAVVENGMVQIPVLYTEPLAAGKTTPVSLKGMNLAPQVDKTPDGDLYYVNNGITDPIAWNVEENGNPIVYVNAYAIQTDSFETVQDAFAGYTGQWNGLNGEYGPVPTVTTVATAQELQAALDAAVVGENFITITDDITGNVTVTQKEGVVITVNGSGKTFAGDITVDGKSARYETAGLTINNVKFLSDDMTNAEAFINLGVSGKTNTRYTDNVTVTNCVFDYSGTGKKVAIKSYTGGDRYLTVSGCTVTERMHSMLQLDNVEQGLKVVDCTVNSKNGINLNNTVELTMTGCTFDVRGYAIRFGDSGTSVAKKTFTLTNNTLKSACEDGDSVIIFRKSATDATLTLEKTTIQGTSEITGNTSATTIIYK